MKHKTISRNFTLIELVTVTTIIVIILMLITAVTTIAMSNLWYTEDGVVARISAVEGGTVRLVEAHRNVFSHSTFVVDRENGNRERYNLDTNLLFNYTTEKVE